MPRPNSDRLSAKQPNDKLLFPKSTSFQTIASSFLTSPSPALPSFRVMLLHTLAIWRPHARKLPTISYPHSHFSFSGNHTNKWTSNLPKTTLACNVIRIRIFYIYSDLTLFGIASEEKPQYVWLNHRNECRSYKTGTLCDITCDQTDKAGHLIP